MALCRHIHTRCCTPIRSLQLRVRVWELLTKLLGGSETRSETRSDPESVSHLPIGVSQVIGRPLDDYTALDGTVFRLGHENSVRTSNLALLIETVEKVGGGGWWCA